MRNFKSANPGTWFYYDPDNEDQGGVCLRELSTVEYERIERITVKTKKKFKHGVPYDDVQTDDHLAFKLRWDFCIVDWSKTCLDSQELDCDSDNKVKMMKVVDFVKFVANSLDELVDSNKSIEEARPKNLGTSSNGSSKSQTVKDQDLVQSCIPKKD